MVRTVVPVSTSRLARCLGVGVDPDDSGDLAFDPGLLERLADRGLGDGLSEVHHAAGERPVALVRAPDEHDAARPIGYDDVDGRDEGAGPRGVRVVVVVDPAGGGQQVHPQSPAVPAIEAIYL
jgi:hypothetical protein